MANTTPEQQVTAVPKHRFTPAEMSDLSIQVVHIKALAEALLEPMRDALQDQGVGTIGEIFDGDAPYHPRGAPAQAWSVACTLDAWRLIGDVFR